MVRARYTVEDNTHTLVVLGHANYSECGTDIVCAGVSSLIQALIGWIEENYYKAECISVDTKDSEVIVSCEGGEDVATAFQVVTIGLTQIADSYPDYVQIETIGIAD